jgi:hypothetical protein
MTVRYNPDTRTRPARQENTVFEGPCMVRVVVRNQADPDAKPVHDRVGDHQDPGFRTWMGKTAFWAFRNNHSVYSYPCEIDV